MNIAWERCNLYGKDGVNKQNAPYIGHMYIVSASSMTYIYIISNFEAFPE
jgi:hypothetical protein